MRRPATVLAALVLGIGTAGLAACGGDDATSDVVPKTVPAIVAPADASLPPASTSTTSTTSTTDTTSTTGTAPSTSGGTSATPSTGGTSATPSTGGTTTPSTGGTGGTSGGGTTGTSTTGGTNSGGFSDFCQQNPGACPGQ
jgi:hypothetical protein